MLGMNGQQSTSLQYLIQVRASRPRISWLEAPSWLSSSSLLFSFQSAYFSLLVSLSTWEPSWPTKTSFPPLLLYNSPSIQCNVIPSSSMANPMLSRVGAVEGKARAQHISTTRVTISSLNPKLSEYAQKHFFRKLLYTGKMKHFKFAHSTSTKFCLMAPNVLLPWNLIPNVISFPVSHHSPMFHSRWNMQTTSISWLWPTHINRDRTPCHLYNDIHQGLHDTG